MLPIREHADSDASTWVRKLSAAAPSSAVTSHSARESSRSQRRTWTWAFLAILQNGTW